MRHSHFGTAMRAVPFLLAVPSLAFAQQPGQPPTPAEAAAAMSQQPAAASFTQAQIDQMLAPIALYPDQLLLEFLMASTFPQQVIDAGKWLQGNQGVTGDALVTALQPLPWDPSVKSLVAFPQIIVMMNDHLDWTEALGVAFSNQQVAVMARVQFLRQRAYHAHRLHTTTQLVVQEQGPDIVIQPANPEQIYVPVYNPAEVYGPWPDADAPPVYIPPPPGFYNGPGGGAVVGAAIGFSVGYAIAAPLWGWGHPDWRRHEVVVDQQRYTRITNVTNITNNNIVIENNTWRRTAPVAAVPEAERPRAAATNQNAPHPPGTVSSTAVRLPPQVAHPGTAPTRPAQATPPGTLPVRPGEEARPGAPPTHPAETGRPGVPPTHPAEEVHPGATPTHPAETGRPGVPPTHPTEEAHPGVAPTHPAQEAHPGAKPVPPREVLHPTPAPEHPGGVTAHPTEPAHPAAAPPHPTEPERPAAAPPHPVAPEHPAAAPPHPVAPEHPAAAPPHPAAPEHPAAAPPHPAAQKPAAEPKKPAAKPGEEEKEQH